MLRALEISRELKMHVLLRLTHANLSFQDSRHLEEKEPVKFEPHFERAISKRVMLPGYARPAHRRLREKLAQAAQFNETSGLHVETPGKSNDSGKTKLGIITSGYFLPTCP